MSDPAKRFAASIAAYHTASGQQPTTNSLPHKGAWFLAGAIIGAWLSMWFWFGHTLWEMDKWQCQRYSPIDGECALYLRRGQP